MNRIWFGFFLSILLILSETLRILPPWTCNQG